MKTGTVPAALAVLGYVFLLPPLAVVTVLSFSSGCLAVSLIGLTLVIVLAVDQLVGVSRALGR